MKVTKEELVIAIKGDINCYGGEYGRVDWNITDNFQSFKVAHTEGNFGTKGDTQYIFFEGSSGNKDWHDNFNFFKDPVKANKNNKKAVPYQNVGADIQVHEGFIGQYKLVRENILATTIGKYNQGMKRIIISGHSLGGALCTLCAVDIQFNMPPDLEIICLPMASPRVGNEAFAKSYNARVPETYRFIYKNDIVTRVPMEIMGYKHVGKEILIGEKTKWWEHIIHPISRNIGNPLDHYPQKYLEAIKKLDWK